MKTKISIKKIALVITLIVAAVSWRIINHNYMIAPNFELVTVATVIAAIVLGYKAAIAVPLASMIISDLIIGNTSIFMFTWSAFLIIGLGAILLAKLNKKTNAQILCSVGFAVISSFFFFAFTNFGVWAQGWYPATWSGLAECFALAIPFYRTMLIGNIIMVPTAVAAYQLVKNRQAAKSLVVNSFIS
jgi:hypothetical protein